MKYLCLSILFLSLLSLNAVEHGDPEVSNGVCWIACLPQPILNRIASYLTLSTESYETDGFFEKRLRLKLMKKKKNPLGDVIPISDTQHLRRSRGGSLELVTKREWWFDQVEKLINCSDGDSLFADPRYKIDPDGTLGRLAAFALKNYVDWGSYTVSRDKKRVVALTPDGFQIVDIKKPYTVRRFPLQDYYDTEGTVVVPSEHKDWYIMYEAENCNYYSRETRGYDKKKGISIAHYFHDDDVVLKKEVKKFEIMPGGNRILFCNKNQVFVQTGSECLKVYEISDRPDTFLHNTSPDIRMIGCNNQGSKAGVIIFAWHDATTNNFEEELYLAKRLRALGNEEQWHAFYELVWGYQKGIYRCFFDTHKKFISRNDQQLLERLLSEPDIGFNMLLERIIKIYKIALKLYKAGQVKDRCVIVPLKNEEPLTLQAYFAKRGVCKDLLAQGEVEKGLSS